ncbi:unnamed protein product [Ilex paraguariensis]|uniref:Uncharacterized protein n=1 Tax=Ilex paraguariensis TaxID=185542 RepID=A0ABC8S5M4_9AQUA
MPPEPLSWDRKDFFKERKHERSSDSVGIVSRWRESSHHGPSRWGSNEFNRPTGHGKQGGWYLYSEEPRHRLLPAPSNNKNLEDDRPSGPCGDGKYGTNWRDRRESFSQKEWKGQYWENPASPLGLESLDRPSAVNDQRSVDNSFHPPHSSFVNSWDQQNLKEQHDKNGGVNGLGTGQRFEREDSLGSIGWKHLKWTRSGSLSSRGSGFSHSSSPKSVGVDSSETKAEVKLGNVTPILSPSGDAAASVTSAAPAEETSSRKKPRLGWGEGLAKYEKKKVEVPVDEAIKNGVVTSSNTEPVYTQVSNLADKSPRASGFSDCASPASSSSVACSSLPGKMHSLV